MKTDIKKEKIRVLIVDDHKIMRDTLNAFLRHIENTSVVGMAENGMEAVEMIKMEPADVILMDVSMPFMDGIKATKVIMESNPDIRILALTMHDDLSLLSEALEAGAYGYLTKPVKLAQLQEAITSVTQNKYYLGFRTNLEKTLY